MPRIGTLFLWLLFCNCAFAGDEVARGHLDDAMRLGLVKELEDGNVSKREILKKLVPFRGQFAEREVARILAATRTTPELLYQTIYSIIPFQRIGLDEVALIVELLDKDENADGLAYYALCLTRLRRACGKDLEYFASVRGIIAKPLVRLGKRIGGKPMNLRCFVGQALKEWNLPGAPQVLIAAVSDGLKWHENHPDVGSAFGAMQMLSELTGKPIGTEGNAPTPRSIALAGYDWLEWWNTVSNRPGYALPWDNEDWELLDNYF